MTIKDGDGELKQNLEREDVQKFKKSWNEQETPYLRLEEVFESEEKDNLVFYGNTRENIVWKKEGNERWEFKNFYLDFINYECT